MDQRLGSRNGVFIGEKRVVRPTELKEGGIMFIEEYEFKLEIVEIEPDDPSIVRSVKRPMEELDTKHPTTRQLYWHW